MPLTNAEMAVRRQSTIVDPATTRDEVTRHIEACGRFGFHAAMIPMCWVPLARSILKGTPVRVATAGAELLGTSAAQQIVGASGQAGAY